MRRDEDFDAPALMALEADRLAHAYGLAIFGAPESGVDWGAISAGIK